MRANNFYAQLWVEKCSEAGDLIDLAIKKLRVISVQFHRTKSEQNGSGVVLLNAMSGIN
jgi:imidazoleglycerol phosphate synthase glutamine amidotransferase subunit HisH